MKYQTPIYIKDAVETNDIMTVSSESNNVDVTVEQENDISNVGVALNDLLNKYLG